MHRNQQRLASFINGKTRQFYIFVCFSPTFKALYIACYLILDVKFRNYPLVVYEHLIFFTSPTCSPKVPIILFSPPRQGLSRFVVNFNHQN